MKITWFKRFRWSIQAKIYRIQHWFEIRQYKKKYPDYVDNEYNEGEWKHIWGVKSWDDLSGMDCNLHTMNDIAITYNRNTKLYSIGIETAYIFEDNRIEGECKYLKRLLDAFTKFMDDNGYSKEFQPSLFLRDATISEEAESIEELYTNFRMFVEGYCAVYKPFVSITEYDKAFLKLSTEEIETLNDMVEGID